MRNVWITSAALLAVALLAAPVIYFLTDNKPLDPVQADLAKLQGKWVLKATEMDGKWNDVSHYAVMTIKGMYVEKWEVVGHLGHRTEGGKLLMLDPSKTPKHLDMTRTVKGREFLKMCLYSIAEDELLICMPGLKEERPSRLGTDPDDDARTYKYQRLEK